MKKQAQLCGTALHCCTAAPTAPTAPAAPSAQPLCTPPLCNPLCTRSAPALRPRWQGAIILGIGGDNSDGAVGTFYEGAMLRGYTTDGTDDAMQANIVAAGYGK